MKRYFGIAVGVYCAACVFVAAAFAVAWRMRRNHGIEVLLPGGAWNYSPLILMLVAIGWVLLGCVLLVFWRQPPGRRDALFTAGFILLAGLYLNLLREQSNFYDLRDYIAAARALYEHRPLPPRYLYPPFWALCLRPLAPLGENGLLCINVAANFASLLLFYHLVYTALHRHFGWTRGGAAVAAFALLAANVPVQRTLDYGQINLHVANLILLCMLWAGPRPALSAAALAAATHWKILPAIFVLPFFWTRNWRWLGGFFLFVTVIGLVTLWAGGLEVYRESLANIRAVMSLTALPLFRDNSFNSLIRGTSYVSYKFFSRPMPQEAQSIVTGLLKAAALVGGLWALARIARRDAFGLGGEGSSTALWSGYVILSFLMLLLSPIVWEHYPVWIVAAFLALLRPLRGGELVAYGMAYYLIFLVPTFDGYPFAYTRLLGIGICCALLWRAGGAERAGEGEAWRWLNGAGEAMQGFGVEKR